MRVTRTRASASAAIAVRRFFSRSPMFDPKERNTVGTETHRLRLMHFLQECNLPGQIIATMLHDERLTIIRKRSVVEKVALASGHIHPRLGQQLIVHPLETTAHFHALHNVGDLLTRGAAFEN